MTLQLILLILNIGVLTFWCIQGFREKWSRWITIPLTCLIAIAIGVFVEMCVNFNELEEERIYEEGPQFSDVPDKAHIDTVKIITGTDTIIDYRLAWNDSIIMQMEGRKK